MALSARIQGIVEELLNRGILSEEKLVEDAERSGIPSVTLINRLKLLEGEIVEKVGCRVREVANEAEESVPAMQAKSTVKIGRKNIVLETYTRIVNEEDDVVDLMF